MRQSLICIVGHHSLKMVGAKTFLLFISYVSLIKKESENKPKQLLGFNAAS